MARGSQDWKKAAPQKNYLQLLREGNAFGGLHSHGASATDYNYSQLFNPSTSQVGVLVYRICLSYSEIGGSSFYITDTELSTFDRYGLALKSGGVESDCKIMWEQKGAPTAVGIGQLSALAQDTKIYEPAWIWLEPGYGLEIVNYKANLGLEVFYTWFEFTEY